MANAYRWYVPVASEVVETAMQYMYGALNTGCARTHRPAALSYCAIGSPSLLVSQGPPKPDQSEFPAVGPCTRAPVALSNTAKSRFTHCTNCVVPAAPFVSGGAQQSEKLPRPTPTP